MTREDLLLWAKTEYGTTPEYLWARYPDYAVLRNPDDKWYAVVMNVSRDKLGLSGEDSVDIVNVKADSGMIDMLVGTEGYLRGYHMNKTQWLTILLDGSVGEEEIKNLISESYQRTSKRK